ncbi:hypothetical protein [Pseudomonas syringae]|uniref:hypothetical protein n=1 Tax=Pseudomonas syringae TaxID=317 RepID=UPI001FCDD908|nr:hypothetical protein [Pseudomonas syringae]MCK0547814.1 hypothetical protein [Pseudomonas syringae pv. aptata]
MVFVQILKVAEGVFAVQHAHRLSVLHAGGAVDDGHEMAGLFGDRGDGSIDGGSEHNAGAEHGSKRQQIEDSHRVVSLWSRWLWRHPPPLPEKQNLPCLMMTID